MIWNSIILCPFALNPHLITNINMLFILSQFTSLSVGKPAKRGNQRLQFEEYKKIRGQNANKQLLALTRICEL